MNTDNTEKAEDIVIRVTAAAPHREILRAPITVMDQATGAIGTALADRLLERVEHEVRAEGDRHPTADNATERDITHEGHVDQALRRGDIVKIRHPELVASRRGEIALEEIRRTHGTGRRVSGRRPREAVDSAGESHGSHRPYSGQPRYLLVQLLPDLPRAINLPIRVPDPLNDDTQFVNPFGARRSLRRIELPRVLQKVGRRAIGNTSQIGSTPYVARWSSMNRTITSLGGRRDRGPL